MGLDLTRSERHSAEVGREPTCRHRRDVVRKYYQSASDGGHIVRLTYECEFGSSMNDGSESKWLFQSKFRIRRLQEFWAFERQTYLFRSQSTIMRSTSPYIQVKSTEHSERN